MKRCAAKDPHKQKENLAVLSSVHLRVTGMVRGFSVFDVAQSSISSSDTINHIFIVFKRKTSLTLFNNWPRKCWNAIILVFFLFTLVSFDSL